MIGIPRRAFAEIITALRWDGTHAILRKVFQTLGGAGYLPGGTNDGRHIGTMRLQNSPTNFGCAGAARLVRLKSIGMRRKILWLFGIRRSSPRSWGYPLSQKKVPIAPSKFSVAV